LYSVYFCLTYHFLVNKRFVLDHFSSYGEHVQCKCALPNFYRSIIHIYIWN